MFGGQENGMRASERADPYFQEMNFVAFFPIRGENQKKVENSQVFFFLGRNDYKNYTI